MAVNIERTATEDITDALRALADLERHTRDVRAHLEQAQRQLIPERGTVQQARRVAQTVAALAGETWAHITDAERITACYPE